jgi:hypothetical protein
MLMTVHWMCKHFFYWFLQLKEGGRGKGGSFLSLRLHTLEIWTANYTSVTLAKCPLSWKKNRANHKTHFHFFQTFWTYVYLTVFNLEWIQMKKIKNRQKKTFLILSLFGSSSFFPFYLFSQNTVSQPFLFWRRLFLLYSFLNLSFTAFLSIIF